MINPGQSLVPPCPQAQQMCLVWPLPQVQVCPEDAEQSRGPSKTSLLSWFQLSHGHQGLLCPQAIQEGWNTWGRLPASPTLLSHPCATNTTSHVPMARIQQPSEGRLPRSQSFQIHEYPHDTCAHRRRDEPTWLQMACASPACPAVPAPTRQHVCERLNPR